MRQPGLSLGLPQKKRAACPSLPDPFLNASGCRRYAQEAARQLAGRRSGSLPDDTADIRRLLTPVSLGRAPTIARAATGILRGAYRCRLMARCCSSAWCAATARCASDPILSNAALSVLPTGPVTRDVCFVTCSPNTDPAKSTIEPMDRQKSISAMAATGADHTGGTGAPKRD